MSEEFVHNRKYDLVSLYKLEGELSRLHECFQAWSASPTAGTQDLENKTGRVGELVQRCGLEKAALRAESLGKQLTDTSTTSEEWVKESEGLRFKVEDELTDLWVIRLKYEAIELKKCLQVAGLFHTGVYDLLPFESKLDFQEAGRCFLYEQHRAAVILAFRAAEKMTKEYYYRLTGNDEERQTFGSIWNTLKDANKHGRIHPKIDQTILNHIFNIKEPRNAYVHSGSDLGRPYDPVRMANYIQDAAHLCSRLTQDLRERNKLFAVAIEEPIDFDQALALWLLKREGDGIGRSFYFKTLRDEEQLDMRDVQYKIGGVADWLNRNAIHFKKSSEGFPDCIAHRMNMHLNAKEAYAPLVEFAKCWRQKNDAAPLFGSESPEETLEEVHESLRLRHRGSPEKYLSEIWKLFDAILEGGLKPSDPHLAKSLPSDFSSLVAQARQRLESTAEERRETEYNGQRCLLIETRLPRSDDEYGTLGFPYVIVRDASSFHIRVLFFGSGNSNLKPILVQAGGDAHKFRHAQNQLLSKEPLPGLSLDKMKEIVEIAERARVSLA